MKILNFNKSHYYIKCQDGDTNKARLKNQQVNDFYMDKMYDCNPTMDDFQFVLINDAIDA